MAKRENNEEFMVRIMNFGCPTGPLVHAFILEGLINYAERVIANPPPDGAVSGDAWKRTAEFVQAEINKHLGS